MRTLTRIAVLFILGASCASGQDEDFLGLPVDFDIFGLEADDEFYKEAKPQETYTEPESLLTNLCDQYDLRLDDKIIDCQKISVVPKTANVVEHNIRKRDVEEDTFVEGSGEPEETVFANEEPPQIGEPNQESPPEEADNDGALEEPVPETPIEGENNLEAAVPYDEAIPNEEPAANEETNAEGGDNNERSSIAGNEAPEEEPHQETLPKEIPDTIPEEPAPDAPTDEENKLEQAVPYGAESTGNEGATADEDDAPEAVEGDVNMFQEETHPLEEGKEGEASDAVQQEVMPEEPAGEETKLEPAVPYGEENTETGGQDADEAPISHNDEETPANEENKESAAPQEQAPVAEGDPNQPEPETAAATENPIENSESLTTIVKKGRVLKPEDFEGSKSEDGKESTSSNDGDGSETEKLHEHQSGNAVLDTAVGETLQDSELAVRKLSEKEDIKESSNTDLPKSGESSETQQAGKDSKVLIILLVAVVVIGGAAFAYNFIKKRKQKKSEEARAENGGNNGLQRAPEKDGEHGQEMKPLMRPGEHKPVVEYKDEKQNAKTEVAN